jgi:hypothetical protein
VLDEIAKIEQKWEDSHRRADPIDGTARHMPSSGDSAWSGSTAPSASVDFAATEQYAEQFRAAEADQAEERIRHEQAEERIRQEQAEERIRQEQVEARAQQEQAEARAQQEQADATRMQQASWDVTRTSLHENEGRVQHESKSSSRHFENEQEHAQPEAELVLTEAEAEEPAKQLFSACTHYLRNAHVWTTHLK